MPTEEPERPRARIAEARRNRQRLIQVATRAFATAEGTVPLESIAKDAGVGIGTLYRHFPKREDLVEAVYLDQMERLRTSAEELLAEHRPAEALRLWTSSFLDWVATKHSMIDTVRAVVASGRLDYGGMREQLIAVVSRFLEAGATAGDLRTDVDAADVAATLAGVLTVAGAPEQRPQAERMLGIIVDGLRSRPGTGTAGP
ncbi:TetR/AcrR family transcriptional regulator [Glycomyces arizonensis]|uniref:TetR/AcrR family transcriptional regulator n=1 Tax=Glycomyces arizonensis TaxID=256035 RepID=UPI0004064CD7|nr:TetR/AcrR family transcriptional regulator [Glycomyces arizonensis]